MTTLESRIKHALQRLIHQSGFHVTKYTAALTIPPQAMLAVNLDFLITHHLQKMAGTGHDSSEFYLVQVGAYDGYTNDPIYTYLVKYGWRGLLIEPQKNAFEMLVRNYTQDGRTDISTYSGSTLTFVNAAIGESDGYQDFYQVRCDPSKGDDPLGWTTQIASLDRNHLLKHRKSQPAYGITTSEPDIEQKIEVYQVECLTFNTLIDRYGIQRIDLLQIDAEGYDDRLVLSFPFERLKPAILRYEHMHLSDDRQEKCLAHLVQQGYRVGFEFADTIAYLG